MFSDCPISVTFDLCKFVIESGIMNKYFREMVLLTIICFFCFIVSGCVGRHESADKSIKTYCEAMLHMNPKSLRKLNISPSEFKREFFKDFAGIYNAFTFGIFSDTQINKIGTACLKKYKMVPIKTVLVDKEKDYATVKVIVGCFDFRACNDMEAINRINSSVNTRFSFSQLTDSAMEACIEQIDRIKITGTSEFLVKCTYNRKHKRWEPDNFDAFAADLWLAVLGLYK